METNNSLEITKQLVKDGKISQEIAEIIFPQLKESEDERIRKDLITFLDDIWHLGKMLISISGAKQIVQIGLLGLKSKVSGTLLGVKRI